VAVQVDYDLSAAGVISAFNDVYPGSKEEYNALKNEFAGFNEQGCPLNNSDGSNDGRPKAAHSRGRKK
jgi:hypothetical protein